MGKILSVELNFSALLCSLNHTIEFLKRILESTALVYDEKLYPTRNQFA